MHISNQTLKGLVSTFLVVGFSLLICVSLSPEMLMGWVTLVLVAMVPAQMVISLLWGCGYPERIAGLPQPIRGLMYLFVTASLGALVAWLAWRTVGGEGSPPNPFVIMYLILAVPVTMWLIITFQGWPFNVVLRNPGAVGGAIWLAAYGIAYGLFRLLFNFSVFKNAPFYQPSLDPAGLMMAWLPFVASISSAMLMLCLTLLDFWPTAALAKRFPMLGKQPFFGLVNAVLIAALAAVVWRVFVGAQGMDVVGYMTRICIAMIFGIFVLLVMLEGVPALKLAQPWRGLVLAAGAAVLATALLGLYQLVALHRFKLPAGQPSYALELWLASAMLGVTFPAMVFYASYFKFWPLENGQNVAQRKSP